jgi:hypothetical protein
MVHRIIENCASNATILRAAGLIPAVYSAGMNRMNLAARQTVPIGCAGVDNHRSSHRLRITSMTTKIDWMYHRKG